MITKTAIECSVTTVVLVFDGTRIAVAGHDSVRMLQNHIAVEQIDANRARTTGAALFVLPPVFNTGMENVINEAAA